MAGKRKAADAFSTASADAVISADGKVRLNTRPDDEMEITMLGAGREVGRSCCVIKYQGRTVVCDCGLHPALEGMASRPFLDELDWSTVDCILVTHFHIDHAACLVDVMEKTNFKDGGGRVYMTHPTKAIYRFLMDDFVRHGEVAGSDNPITEDELIDSCNSIIGIDYQQEIVVPPLPTSSGSTATVSFTPLHAGHVLGASMFLIRIADRRILYTGDISTEEDRHLIPAQVPAWDVRPDVLICESTYGDMVLGEKEDREDKFISFIRKTLDRGGKVLMPVFALGRAQELLLILDEYWRTHPEYHNIPIYYHGSLARKCMEVYRQYVHTMNANIRSRFDRGENAFSFMERSGKRGGGGRRGKTSFVQSVTHLGQVMNESRPCVVLASPGMLQSGASRDLMEKWAPDPKNGLLLTAYSVPNTLAWNVSHSDVQDFESIKNKDRKIQLRMDTEYVSFSAHVDYKQNAAFIDQIMPPHLVLVHGEHHVMERLRTELRKRYRENKEDMQIHTPHNCETLKLRFDSERVARAIGKLANTPIVPGTAISGLLVSKDFSYTLISPDDLREFTGLSTSTILQRQRMVLDVSWSLVRWHLEGMYGSIQEGLDKDGVQTMRVMGAVDLKQTKATELTMEWVGSSTNDMIADSVLALVLGIDSSPASVKLTTHSHSHPHADHASEDTKRVADEAAPKTGSEDIPSRIDRLIAFLHSHFGKVELLTREEAETSAAAHEKARSAKQTRESTEPATTTDDLKPTADVKKEAVNEEMTLKDAAAEIDPCVAPDDLDPPQEPKRLTGAPVLRVRLDDDIADLDVDDLSVTASHARLLKRVESIVELALQIITPLSHLATATASQADDAHDLPPEEGNKTSLTAGRPHLRKSARTETVAREESNTPKPLAKEEE